MAKIIDGVWNYRDARKLALDLCSISKNKLKRRDWQAWRNVSGGGSANVWLTSTYRSVWFLLMVADGSRSRLEDVTIGFSVSEAMAACRRDIKYTWSIRTFKIHAFATSDADQGRVCSTCNVKEKWIINETMMMNRPKKWELGIMMTASWRVKWKAGFNNDNVSRLRWVGQATGWIKAGRGPKAWIARVWKLMQLFVSRAKLRLCWRNDSGRLALWSI